MEEQVSEAKEMLLSKDSQQKEEAVKILIAISRQGSNKEATDLLAKCLEESQGITPETEDDVKWCVKIAEEEKKLRYAVEQLYNSVKKDGEDKVAIQDIDEAMKRAKEKQKVGYNQMASPRMNLLLLVKCLVKSCLCTAT